MVKVTLLYHIIVDSFPATLYSRKSYTIPFRWSPPQVFYVLLVCFVFLLTLSFSLFTALSCLIQSCTRSDQKTATKPRTPPRRQVPWPKVTCTSVSCVTTMRQATTTVSGLVRAARLFSRGAFKVPKPIHDKPFCIFMQVWHWKNSNSCVPMQDKNIKTDAGRYQNVRQKVCQVNGCHF